MPPLVVYLQLVDGLVRHAGEDELDEGRSALHRELEASIAEADAGEMEDFSALLAELRAR